MVLAVIGAIAQFERELAIERVKNTLRSAALHDKKINGGCVIYGFRRDPDKKGKWIKVDDEIANIELLLRDFVSHGSLKKTLQTAELKGIKNRSGKPFTFTSLRKLFENRKLVGDLRVVHGDNDELETFVKLPYGEVISRDLFNKVQTQLGIHDTSRPNQNRLGERTFLFTNLLFSESGVSYTTSSACGRSGEKYSYYIERKHKMKVNADLFEQKVLSSLVGSLASEEQMESHAQRVGETHKQEIEALETEFKLLGSDMAELRKREVGIIAGLGKVSQNSAEDLIGLLNQQARDVSDAKARMSARQIELEYRQEELLSFDIDIKKHRARALEILKNITKAEPIRQRHFIRQVIEKIELNKSGEATIYWKFGKVLTAGEEMVVPTQNWLRRRDSNPRQGG